MSNEPEPQSVEGSEGSALGVRLCGDVGDRTAAVLASRGFVIAEGSDADVGTGDTADIDCIVVGVDVAEDGDVERRADRPVVLYAPEPTAVDDLSRFSGYARTGDVDALCDQLRWVVARGETQRGTCETREGQDGARTSAARSDARLEALHEGTVSLIGATTPTDLFERTVDIASHLLEFDSCYIAIAEDGVLVKQAGVGDVTEESLPIDYGLVGDSYQTGKTHLVGDTYAHPDAKPARASHRSGIAVPLGDDGVFVVIADEPNAFTVIDRGLAELLVRYTEGTLARIRSAEAIQERRDLIETLHDGTAALAAVTTLEDAAVVAVELAERILSFDTCYVGVREGDVVVPYAVSSGAPPDAARPMKTTQGLVGETIRTGESQLVDRIEESNADPTSDTYRSGISVPLGKEGVFQAVSTEEAAFDANDLELAELLGDHLTGTFSRVRAEADLGQQRRRVAQLHAATVELVSCHDVVDLYERAIETARSVLGFDTAYIFVVENDQFVPVAQAIHEDHDPVGTVSLDHGVASETHRTGRSRLVRDVSTAEGAEPLQTVAGGGISVPLGDDGVFQAVSRDPETFDESDLELAELLASHVTANRERLRAETELRSQRDRLSALFENIPDAAVSYRLVDGDPHVQAVNPAFERVFGFTNEELVGENLDEYVIADDPEQLAEARRMNARLKAGESVRTECQRQTNEGLRTFILQVVPLELGQENVAGFAIYTDITDRQERERELRRQNERLEEFANIISHDLRNPLAVASGYLDLAAETGDPSAFERVETSLDRMDRLVEDLLSLARKGQVVGEPVPLDLATVATQAWGGVRTIDATLERPESLPVEGDESRLVELFENLFRNAIEHAGDSVTVRVEALDDTADEVRGFAVEDDGPGIPPEKRDQVCDPGETTSTEGIGYGLAIVQRIVEAHGWSLSVTEGSEGGARFEVRF
ncbi:GAF domain-containing sensor histidine kinase [Salinigranum rubrum]|uniref:GAF domain-containing sensor histidine kinase n=1 Tax=Salinigranum rubrum TaxID=755307 RepID=UPI0013A56048|nr:GAF domain-containing protein [Salinigranum rubrum]